MTFAVSIMGNYRPFPISLSNVRASKPSFLFVSDAESQPLSHVILADSLRRAGVETYMLANEWGTETKQEKISTRTLKIDLDFFSKALDCIRPNFIGFTIYEENYISLIKTIEWIRKIPKYDDIYICLGGPPASHRLKLPAVVEHTGADFAIGGAGETVIIPPVKILGKYSRSAVISNPDILRNNPGYDTLKTLNRFYLRLGDIVIDRSLTAPNIFNIRNMSPVFDVFTYEGKEHGIQYLDSLGCNNACSFCTPKLVEGRFQGLTPNESMERFRLIIQMINQGEISEDVKVFDPQSNDFFTDKDRIISLCNLINADPEIKEYFKSQIQHFHVETSIKSLLKETGGIKVADREFLSLVKETFPYVFLVIGTDFFNDSDLSWTNKGDYLEQIEEVVKTLEDLKIPNEHYSILNTINSKFDVSTCSLFMMIKLAIKYRYYSISDIINAYLIPFYGTAAYRYIEENNLWDYVKSEKVKKGEYEYILMKREVPIDTKVREAAIFFQTIFSRAKRATSPEERNPIYSLVKIFLLIPMLLQAGKDSKGKESKIEIKEGLNGTIIETRHPAYYPAPTEEDLKIYKTTEEKFGGYYSELINLAKAQLESAKKDTKYSKRVEKILLILEGGLAGVLEELEKC